MLDYQTFDHLMAPFGGFEAAPHIAVAVSGGADSLALCLLADRWARHRAGRVTALIVDHGLRKGSDAEARRVAGWLARRDIAATLLRWSGAKPKTNLQDAARRARYALMTAWCRAAGVLHLLVAHHIEDQGETFLLRLARGSGATGLAAMPGLTETGEVRIVRPLLSVSKADLKQYLVERGQPWIEDPTNRGFARGRLRAGLAAVDAAGVSLRRAAQAAAGIGATRAVIDKKVAEFLAESVTVHAAGFCLLEPDAWHRSEVEIGQRALAQVLVCVGGNDYPPRCSRQARLAAWLRSPRSDRGCTLGGCRLVPLREKILVCRETRAARDFLRLWPGRSALWDRRFAVRLARRPAPSKGSNFTVARLGGAGWRQVVSLRPDLRASAIPYVARGVLPALWDLDGVAEVPHLGFVRPDHLFDGAGAFAATFRPARPLASAPFFPVTGNLHAMLRT